MGVFSKYAGLSISCGTVGASFLDFNCVGKNTDNSVAGIQCNINSLDEPNNNIVFALGSNYMEAFKTRLCFPKKVQIGSVIDNKTAMLDVMGTCNIIGDTTIVGTLTVNTINILELINSKASSTTSYTKAESDALITN